ncbi:hypothetical protein [Nonomuraea sp. NPDC003214]
MTQQAAQVRCVRESDGFHVHRYLITTHPDGEVPTPAIVDLHLHTWMEEHRREHPAARDVNAYRRQGLGLDGLGEYDTVEQAWAALAAAGDIPPVACSAQS